jgi:hypothetical protein
VKLLTPARRATFAVNHENEGADVKILQVVPKPGSARAVREFIATQV